MVWVQIQVLFFIFGITISFHFERPGSVLFVETIGLVDNIEIQRMIYLTTLNNASVPAKTLIFRPQDTQPNGYLLFYGHQTVGVNCRCSVANNGTLHDKINNVPRLREFIRVGFTVIEPDYYGFVCEQIHPYLVGSVVAHSMLDAVRATRSLYPGLSSVVSGYGWSQGAHSVLWTQSIAPTYAPELQIKSIYAIAPPTNLSLLVDHSLTSYAGIYLSILGIYSWPHYYPDLFVSSLVKGKHRFLVTQLAQVCVLDPHPETNLQLAGLLLLRSQPWLHSLPSENPLWQKVLNENSAPLAIYTQTPLFVFQGKQDALIPWTVTEKWVLEHGFQAPLFFFLYEQFNHNSVVATAMSVIYKNILELYGFQK